MEYRDIYKCVHKKQNSQGCKYEILNPSNRDEDVTRVVGWYTHDSLRHQRLAMNCTQSKYKENVLLKCVVLFHSSGNVGLSSFVVFRIAIGNPCVAWCI